jgi:hypothetical protein
MGVKLTEIVAVKVRMSEGLRRLLASEGRRRGMSLNKEIVRRLEKSFEQETTTTMFHLIADLAVDTAYSRLGLGKPSNMIDHIEQKLGPEAAKTFAAGTVDAASRKAKTNG